MKTSIKIEVTVSSWDHLSMMDAVAKFQDLARKLNKKQESEDPKYVWIDTLCNPLKVCEVREHEEPEGRTEGRSD
jgi:hypothetical protein